jgi:hypothetical protein
MPWSKYNGFNVFSPSKYGDFAPSLKECPLYELQSLYFCCKAAKIHHKKETPDTIGSKQCRRTH